MPSLCPHQIPDVIGKDKHADSETSMQDNWHHAPCIGSKLSRIPDHASPKSTRGILCFRRQSCN